MVMFKMIKFNYYFHTGLLKRIKINLNNSNILFTLIYNTGITILYFQIFFFFLDFIMNLK